MTELQQQICEPAVGDEEWGKTGDSCTQEPFRFQHHYRCTPGLFQWLNATGRTCDYLPGSNTLVNAPCTDGSMCIFQPRVYVRDNWDYCTGVCEGGADGGESCFDSSSAYDQCNGDVFPIIDVLDPYWNPWINWDGTIQVSPE